MDRTWLPIRPICRKSLTLVMLVLAGLVRSAPDSTAAPPDTARPTTVLIAKGNSALENAVCRILTDSLSALHYVVKVVNVATVNGVNPKQYAAVVLMHAVEAGELNPLARKLIERTPVDERDRILISTVHGEGWKSGEDQVSAVASATKSYKPVDIAARIMERLRRSLRPF
jgi:hypothetical protein